jgi:UDP-N-acetylglucosamine 2-epimerase (non-hydrolysing)/GDP/UDP-N,N'-diacetylbacillosamine 2-epimerase (hydrolysing)
VAAAVAGGQAIIRQLDAFGVLNYKNTQVKSSLGRYLYHGVLALARDPEIRITCLGNSSSGLKETPAFGCPSVNIGSRQEGRLRGGNVLDARYSSNEIYDAVQRSLFDEDFREQCRKAKNPYWLGEAGPKIAEILANAPLDQDLIRKRMTIKGEIKDGWHR